MHAVYKMVVSYQVQASVPCLSYCLAGRLNHVSRSEPERGLTLVRSLLWFVYTSGTQDALARSVIATESWVCSRLTVFVVCDIIVILVWRAPSPNAGGHVARYHWAVALVLCERRLDSRALIEQQADRLVNIRAREVAGTDLA
jgi:hypothetical protein